MVYMGLAQGMRENAPSSIYLNAVAVDGTRLASEFKDSTLQLWGRRAEGLINTAVCQMFPERSQGAILPFSRSYQPRPPRLGRRHLTPSLSPSRNGVILRPIVDPCRITLPKNGPTACRIVFSFSSHTHFDISRPPIVEPTTIYSQTAKESFFTLNDREKHISAL